MLLPLTLPCHLEKSAGNMAWKPFIAIFWTFYLTVMISLEPGYNIIVISGDLKG